MVHYLITNRAILTDATGKEYIKEDGGEAAGENLRFGTFDSSKYTKADPAASIELFPEPVTVSRNHVTQAPCDVPYQKSDLLIPESDLPGSTRLFTDLYKAMAGPGGGDLLFFVHGFHTDLFGALESVYEIEKKYIVDNDSPIKHIVFFTWPAMNKLLRYRDDAKDAELSGFTLARCYLMLIDFFKTMFLHDSEGDKITPCGNNIHLMAHSMGNRVVENMMMELLRQRGDNITALFKEVILAAADTDWQIFEDPRAFYSLVNISQRVTVYYNTRDLALFVSETTKNAYNRLGKYGFRDFHKVPSHVYSVDCSAIHDEVGIETKLVEHWYYKESTKVVADITAVLKGIPIEQFISGSRIALPGNALQYRLLV